MTTSVSRRCLAKENKDRSRRPGAQLTGSQERRRARCAVHLSEVRCAGSLQFRLSLPPRDQWENPSMPSWICYLDNTNAEGYVPLMSPKSMRPPSTPRLYGVRAQAQLRPGSQGRRQDRSKVKCHLPVAWDITSCLNAFLLGLES